MAKSKREVKRDKMERGNEKRWIKERGEMLEKLGDMLQSSYRQGRLDILDEMLVGH